MDPSQDIRAEFHRPRRRAVVAGPLLLAALTSFLAVPNAGAALGTAPEAAPVAGAATEEAVTASASSAATPPPAAAPVPPPSAAETPTAAVDRSLDSDSGAPAADVVPEPVRAAVSEPAHQAVETVGAVAKDGNVNRVPIVGDVARRAGDEAGLLTESAAQGTRTDAAPRRPSSVPDSGNRTAGEGRGEPAPRSGRAGPPAAVPGPANGTLARPVPRQEILFVTSGDGSTLPFALEDGRRSLNVTVVTPPSSGDAPRSDPPSRNTPSPSPAPPVGAALASSLGGAGFAFSVLLLGLIATFALAAPRSPPRRLAAACRYRSALFVCALERPG